MTLQQLKYVIVVAEKGTISAASKFLFISQPSLSNAIRELEKEIQINIFNRTNKGIVISNEGAEFIGYARQVVEQSNLLENKYLNAIATKQHFSVSTQHYSFAVNAFVELIQSYGKNEYDFTIRETRTHEIIQDVKNLRSEIGIIYISKFNKKVIDKLLKESNLEFTELFIATPHVFISLDNPLAKNKTVTLHDLENYPYLSFEQGEYNSFYFSEEILSTMDRRKSIKVSDRATLFNLVIGLNGYTISTGIISEELNGAHIIAVPLEIDEEIHIGTIIHKDMVLSRLGNSYIEELNKFKMV
ncbi:MAG TPA: LysR family transcriptional regulator [Lachnospiraceae bacterium]|nr:LysR family transcriptional regulator [Lachnospiraceae bacterium]